MINLKLMFKIKFIKKIFAKIKITLFILRLIFSNKNEIRYKIFDSFIIKKFLFDDNWEEIINNHPNNKPINYSKKNNETCVLIPGRLRCWDKSKELIYSIAEKCKVFIMTDLSDKKISNSIKHKNIKITIIEESIYQKDYSNLPNIGLAQYLKLKCAIDQVYKYERKNHFFFKNFIKIRTDYFYLNSENLLDMTLENNEEYLFSQSDLNFSGRREFFLPLKNYYEFAEWTYFNDFHNIKYLPINPTQIIKSDPGATRFNWLQYPEKIIGKTRTLRPSGDYIRKKIIKKYNKFLRYKLKVNDKIKGSGGQDYFASEQSFALFLNLIGTPCKTHYKYTGYLMNYPKKINEDGIKPGVKEYRNDMEKFKKINFKIKK